MAKARTNSPWFPDFVASWYDKFCDGYPYEKADHWRKGGEEVIAGRMPAFIEDPNKAAADLDSWIIKSSYKTEVERRYRALQIASSAIAEVGFQVEARNDSKAWRPLQRHWMQQGNLLRGADGYLLPVEKRNYPWAWRRNALKHTFESHFSHFDSFARWQPSRHPSLSRLRIRVTILPRSSVPTESLERQLKVAVVPIVDSIEKFSWEPDDTQVGFPCFRVSLRNPDVIGRAAQEALKQAAEQRCDIVVFPELCLTSTIQDQIGESLFKSSASYPWLVVAGSAPTPLAPEVPSVIHNHAVVFNGRGLRVLNYHKLNRYEISRREQGRYGLSDVFGDVERSEDINTEPFEVEILDTPVGRLAVLICEDLSAVELFGPLVSGLGLDWLLAPVLDGSQTSDRWTAIRGKEYAERGAALVVATSLSLVTRHCEYEATKGKTLSPGVGLVVRPTLFGERSMVLPSSGRHPDLRHDFPVAINLVDDTDDT